MPYAEGRAYYDADSHLMETSDWLVQYAEPDIRDRIRPLNLGGAGKLADAAVRDAGPAEGGRGRARRHRSRLDDPQGLAARTAPSIPTNAAGRSTCSASTGNSCSRRSRRPSSSTTTPSCSTAAPAPTTGRWPSSAADDDRLIAVGFVPLQDPGQAVQAVDEALAFGCGAILVPSHPPRTHSPTHPDLDGVWARLQDAAVPLMLARRRGRTTATTELPRERTTQADGLPRRRREHPVEGLHGPAQPARDLHRRDGARRRVREVPAD